VTHPREALTGSGKVFFLIAVLFLFAGALRLNDISLYTPDSARYVIWGNSIASGKGFFDDTQPEGHAFVFHAPLYPVLIAPVELIFPLDVEPVKSVTLLWGLAALCLFYFWVHRLIGRSAALAGAAVMALNPMFLVYSTEVLSEVPFIAFTLIALTLLTGMEKGDEPGRGRWWALVVTTASLGLLREVGVLLWLVVCAYLFGRAWKQGAVVLVAGVVALGGWYLRNAMMVGAPTGSPGGNAGLVFTHLLTDPEGPFLAELTARLSLNLSSYLPSAAGMLFFPLSGGDTLSLLPDGYAFSGGVRLTVICLASAAIAAGMVRAVRSGWGGRSLVASWFALLLAASVYPVLDTRFLFPLLPFSLYFALDGIRAGVATAGGGKRLAASALLSAGILVAGPNLPVLAGLIDLNMRYRADPSGEAADGAGESVLPAYYTRPWGVLKNRLALLPDSAAVMATPAKDLALVSGGRKVLELDPGVTQTIFDRLLRVNDVGYLLDPLRWGDLRVYEFLMNESRRFDFQEVVRAGDLHVMKVTPRPFKRDDFSPPPPVPGGGAESLLRRARASIRRGECAPALDDLRAAARIEPDRAEISYQAIVASAMTGDTVRAREEFRRLLSMRQAGSYLASSRYHLYLMDLLISASGLPPGQDRVTRMYDLGRRYWDHGYYRMARELLNAEMSRDSSFFVGHLWAFHFNFQMGDTATAKAFLGRLDAIDSTNSLVRNFHTLMDLGRRVRALGPSPERASIRLAMARIYRDIELPDECADEGEGALADDPGDSAALLFLAETYSAGGYPRRALGFYRRYLGFVPGDTGAAAAADSLSGVSGGAR
jgi:4-amino-4-deoxy-L-arabinose transferase-like glycosyltransferase/tetratricopeptide (TPR) repeat protein